MVLVAGCESSQQALTSTRLLSFTICIWLLNHVCSRMFVLSSRDVDHRCALHAILCTFTSIPIQYWCHRHSWGPKNYSNKDLESTQWLAIGLQLLASANLLARLAICVQWCPKPSDDALESQWKLFQRSLRKLPCIPKIENANPQQFHSLNNIMRKALQPCNISKPLMQPCNIQIHLTVDHRVLVVIVRGRPAHIIVAECIARWDVRHSLATKSLWLEQCHQNDMRCGRWACKTKKASSAGKLLLASNTSVRPKQSFEQSERIRALPMQINPNLDRITATFAILLFATTPRWTSTASVSSMHRAAPCCLVTPTCWRALSSRCIVRSMQLLLHTTGTLHWDIGKRMDSWIAWSRSSEYCRESWVLTHAAVITPKWSCSDM